MNKAEIIRKYLLEGSDKKEKFEIAWDIVESLEKIKLFMRKKVLTELVNKIKNDKAFNGYEIRDYGLLKCRKWSPLRIYKREWIVNEVVPLSYAVEAGNNNCFELYFGIQKWDDEKGIPFKGNWEKENLPDDWKSKFLEIKGNLPKSWKVSDAWIVWKWFDSYYRGMWQKDFYMEIIENGYSSVADYYLKEILNLKDQTEKPMNEFIKCYKNYEK